MATIFSYANGTAPGILSENASLRRFAYIDTKANYQKNPDINTYFRDSLIIIGDEERAFVPVLNSYIGPSKSDIDNIAKDAADKSVTSLNGTVRNTYLSGENSLSGKYTDANYSYSSTNDNIIKGDSTDYLFNSNGLLTSENLSGINVTTYIAYYTTDSKNVISTAYNTSNFTNVTLGGKTLDSFNSLVSYLIDNHDFYIGSYLAIDDKNTVDYAKKAVLGSLAYSTKFTKDFTKDYTNDQINKLYSQIVGIEYIPLDFNEDGSISASELSGVDNKRYINAISVESSYYNTAYFTYNITTDNQYIEVSTLETADGLKTATLPSVLPSGTLIKYNINYATIEDGKTIEDVNYTHSEFTYTVPDSGLVIDTTNKTITFEVPANSTIKTGATIIALPIDGRVWAGNAQKASGLSNITGAISTISQVAEILDKITDGAEDGGVSLAYSIADNRLDIDVLSKKVESIISPEQGPDKTIYNVNTIEADNLNSSFIALNITGNYNQSAGDSWDETNTVNSSDITHKSAKASGDITLTLSTKVGTFASGIDASTSTKYQANHLTISKISDVDFNLWEFKHPDISNGLATVEGVSSYVSSKSLEILGKATKISYTLIDSLTYNGDSGDDKSNLNYITVTDKISEQGGIVTASHKNISVSSSTNIDVKGPDNDGNPLVTSISKTDTGSTIHVSAYTASIDYYLAHKDDGGNGANRYFAYTADIYSYIMNLVSWVDLTNITAA